MKPTRRYFLTSLPGAAYVFTRPLKLLAIQEPQEQEGVTLENLINQLADEHGNDNNTVEDSEKRNLEAFFSTDEFSIDKTAYLLYDVSDMPELLTNITYNGLYKIMRNKKPLGPGARLYNQGDFRRFYSTDLNQTRVLRIEIKHEEGKSSFEELRIFEIYINLVSGERKSTKINLIEK